MKNLCDNLRLSGLISCNGKVAIVADNLENKEHYNCFRDKEKKNEVENKKKKKNKPCRQN